MIFLYIYCKLNLACFLGQNPVCLGAEVRFDTTHKIDMFEADMYLVNGLWLPPLFRGGCICFVWGLSPGDPVITLDAFGPYPLHRSVRWYISQANDLRPEAREWSRDDPLRWYKVLLIDSTSRGISLLTSTLRFISLFVRFQGIIYLFIKTTSIDQKETD